MTVSFHTIDVAGCQVNYREAGEPGAPKLVLLGGFPSSSHQWRNLLPALADRGFHVVAPDYPGFGHTEAPDDFTYTFDHLSEVVEQWLNAIGFTSFGLYHQGCVMAARHIEDRWQRADRKGKGARWRARWLDADDRERSRSFDRKADAHRHLAEVVTGKRRSQYGRTKYRG